MHTFSNPMIFLMILINTLIYWKTFQLSKQKGKNSLLWLCLAFAFGLIALIVLYFLPVQKSKKEPPAIEPSLVFPLMKEWFYLDQEKQAKGPYFLEPMQKMWKEGILNSQTYVWSEGMEDWKLLKEVDHFEEVLAQELLQPRG